MHVKAKKTATLGVMMALAVILVVLSGVIEISTFFLLALASFFTGIAIFEYGIGYGSAFSVGSIILSFFLAPNKLYVGTYLGFCFYIIATEFVWNHMCHREYNKKNNTILIMVKLICFNLMYLPILLLFPHILFSVEMSTGMFIILLISGQLILFIYDKAYQYFMNRYWLTFRRRLGL